MTLATVDENVDDSGADLVTGAGIGQSDSRGAPTGNRNAWRHGLYSPRGPRGTTYIDRQTAQYRRALEDAVVAMHGEEGLKDELGLYRASLIQTAVEAVKIAMAELNEIRDSKKLRSSDRTAKRQAALRALDLRDRKLKEIGLDKPPEFDPWAMIDALPADNGNGHPGSHNGHAEGDSEPDDSSTGELPEAADGESGDGAKPNE